MSDLAKNRDGLETDGTFGSSAQISSEMTIAYMNGFQSKKNR